MVQRVTKFYVFFTLFDYHYNIFLRHSYSDVSVCAVVYNGVTCVYIYMWVCVCMCVCVCVFIYGYVFVYGGG